MREKHYISSQRESLTDPVCNFLCKYNIPTLFAVEGGERNQRSLHFKTVLRHKTFRISTNDLTNRKQYLS